MAGVVSGSFIMPLLADRLLKSGRRDGLVLTALACIVLTVAFYIPAFTAPTFERALAFALVATFFLAGLSQLSSLAVQLITPARLRGLFTAVLLFISNILGLGLGPSVVAAISDALPEGPATLGKALAILTAVVGPITFLLLLQARRPVADAIAHAAQEEAASRGT
jgi:MFS family permease